jgi:hypothetical protein
MAATVVIPTWNRAELLGRVLENLGRQTQQVARVVVVDNGSMDASVAVAERAGAEVIALGENAGFAAAVNRGIRACQTPWIVVVNNDVTFEPDWLGRLVAALESNSGAWFACGKLLGPEGRIDGTFDAVCRGGCPWRCGHGREDGPLWNEAREIQLAPFTAAIFRAELFERVGMLDEQFGSYLEDVDFGLRCAEAGLSGLYVPQAVAYHQGSATLGRWHPDTVRKMARNQMLLIAKHYPADWIKRYGWCILVAQLLWGLVALRHGAFFSYVAGKIDGLRRFRGARGEASPQFAGIVESSEREIHELQRRTGFDLFWRLYFALT